MGHRVVDDAQLRHLSSVARDVAEIANLHPPVNAPYVGAAAFTHKGGQHVDAMRKAAYAYQHIDPRAVGNRMRSVVSSQSGGANILERAGELGIVLGDDRALVRNVIARVKELEHRGYAFEDADGSFELLVERTRGQQPSFEVIDYLALVEQREGQALVCEATVKVRIGEVVVHTAADGNGPVNALDAALRKALSPTFPETATTQLHDYKVRVLDGHGGTAAAVRVLIESGDHERRWSTVGCSTNIIEASCVALADAFEYCIVQARRPVAENAATA
jgi:2-isopropylmalate synthase